MTGNPDSSSESESEALKAGHANDSEQPEPPAAVEPEAKKKSALREFALLAVIAVGLYYLMLTFVARPYLIPSESMEPTLHGCAGCVGDRILVDKISYRFGTPQPGDVVVFKGPPNWNTMYRSIRSANPVWRSVQNVLSVIGFVPPDENDLVKRVIAVGGQTVQCRRSTGLTVDGKPLKEPYLDPATMRANPAQEPCLGREFGPVAVPPGRLWVMGDNRTNSADSRIHCASTPPVTPVDPLDRVDCLGDPNTGTVPVANVIGKVQFIVWPPSRWGAVHSVNPAQGQ